MPDPVHNSKSQAAESNDKPHAEKTIKGEPTDFFLKFLRSYEQFRPPDLLPKGMEGVRLPRYCHLVGASSAVGMAAMADAFKSFVEKKCSERVLSKEEQITLGLNSLMPLRVGAIRHPQAPENEPAEVKKK
jgi:hypothetical protein